MAQHRRDVATLNDLALRDLEDLWARVNDAVGSRELLLEVLPMIVQTYGSAAATLGADLYDELRDASGVRGRFVAIPAEVPNRSRMEALARWGVGPLFSAEPDKPAALSLVQGGLQRVIADMDRETVIGSLREDPQGAGWSRVTSGGCDFCDLIASRGAVYSADTADFASHDHCQCVAVPEFGLVKDVLPYTPSQRFTSQSSRDANNARVRDSLRQA